MAEQEVTKIEEQAGEHAAEQAATEPAPVEIQAAVQPGAEDAVSAPPQPEAVVPAVDMNWYIIHTYSGFEQKVAESLKGRAQAFGFADQIGRYSSPPKKL